jgi:hypothetical protein
MSLCHHSIVSSRAGMILEYAGSQMLSEMSCHMLAQLTARSEASRIRLRIIDVQCSFDYRRWWFQVRGLMNAGLGRPMTAEEESRLLLSVQISRCETALQLLTTLRALELEVAEDKHSHHVFGIVGMSNLFWGNLKFRRAADAPDAPSAEPRAHVSKRRRPDFMGAVVQMLRQLSTKSVTILVAKLIIFPQRSATDDYFGKSWTDFVNVRVCIDEPRMKSSQLGKPGVPAKATLFDVENPSLRTPFGVAQEGLIFL